MLRAKVPEENVSVIPNAVDTAYFTPNPIDRHIADGHSQQGTTAQFPIPIHSPLTNSLDHLISFSYRCDCIAAGVSQRGRFDGRRDIETSQHEECEFPHWWRWSKTKSARRNSREK